MCKVYIYDYFVFSPVIWNNNIWQFDANEFRVVCPFVAIDIVNYSASWAATIRSSKKRGDILLPKRYCRLPI